MKNIKNMRNIEKFMFVMKYLTKNSPATENRK